MKYFSIPPAERHQQIVRSYWVLESDAPYTHYSMAEICPELLFHYEGRFSELFANGSTAHSFTAGIHGPGTSIRKFHINSAFAMFGVYFYPQAIPLLFKIPATDCANQMPDLSDLLKHVGNALEEQVGLAASTAERIAVIERFLDECLRSNYQHSNIFHAIAQLVHHPTSMSIKELSENYYLSERQFERQFKHYTGLTPKLFSRISRFHRAMKQYGNPGQSLTSIALESGYYDQSHFIHDFKEFSGLHPKTYFSGRSEATAWME
jgi:AraC-like DNA-binding protein